MATGIVVSGGPFILATWTHGLQMVYARNPYSPVQPALDRIVVEFVPDTETAFQLLRRGEVDALGPYEGIDVARRAASIAGVTSTHDAGTTWAGLWLNTRASVLSDVRVRRALARALDRPGIVDGLVRDGGALLDAAAVGDPPVFSGFRRSLAQAKQLLQDAGWTGGPIRKRNGADLSVTVGTVGDELTERVLHAMHVQAAEAGIDLNVVDLDPDQLWRDWVFSTSRLEAALLIERDPPGGALDARFDSRRRAPGGENVSGIADRALDRALRSADQASDVAGPERAQAEQRIAELLPVIPLYQVTVVVVAGPHAGGLVANASQDGFLWDAEHWYRRAA
jgi:ABC-type transport system substrate-binding protein